jgi:predicted HTH domain antitoxin
VEYAREVGLDLERWMAERFTLVALTDGDRCSMLETAVRLEQDLRRRYAAMPTATIDYPSELTTALGKRPGDAIKEIQLMAALKLYEAGRISSGLAARVAGVSRVEFLALCGQYGVTVFQQTADEIESDVKAATHARRG